METMSSQRLIELPFRQYTVWLTLDRALDTQLYLMFRLHQRLFGMVDPRRKHL